MFHLDSEINWKSMTSPFCTRPDLLFDKHYIID